MAMKENNVRVLDYLKSVGDKNVTSADVADALGMEKKSVDGIFTSFQRKDIGVRVTGVQKGVKEVSFLSITAEGEGCDREPLNENAIKVLDYLISVKGTYVTIDDLATATGIEKKSATGVYNALVKKGFCARTPKNVEADVEVKYLKLTEKGMAFDPAADAE
jgi:DNA-binding IclR family transcriptional regulator